MPRSNAGFPALLGMTHNPLQTILFDPTSTVLGAQAAMALPDTEKLLAQAILELLKDIDNVTGLDLLGLAEALRLLFGGSQNLLLALLDSIPVLGPIIAVLTGTNPITALEGATKEFAQFFLDIFSVLGNPGGMGTGNPVVNALFTSIPVLLPLFNAIQTSLINPVVGTIENALPWVLPFVIGGETTLLDLGNFINGLVTQQELQELRDLVHNTLQGNSGVNWVQGVTKTALADTLQTIQTGVQTANTVAQNALGQIQSVGSTIVPTVQSIISTAQIDAAQLIGTIETTLLPDITIAMSSGIQTLADDIRNNLLGIQNPGTNASHTDAAAALAVAGATSSASAARLAVLGNGGEEQVDVDFSTYSNGGAPAIFTVISTSGTAPAVSGGLFTLTAVSAADTKYYCNTASYLGDYQQVSATIHALTGNSNSFTLFARENIAGTTEVLAIVTSLGVTLQAAVANVSKFNISLTDVFTPGATYTLLCGDPSTNNLYKYQVLKNGVPLTIGSVFTGDNTQVGHTFYNDVTQQSSGTISGATRNAGLQFDVFSSGTVSISDFAYQDTAGSTPAVLVTTSESTASTTYTDLATISDEVAVNIGATGLALLCLSCEIPNQVTGQLGLMSFALSGANTLAASDDRSIGILSVGGTYWFGGAPFLLTGLSPGLTIFKAKYRSTNAGTVTFVNRRVGVVAL